MFDGRQYWQRMMLAAVLPLTGGAHAQGCNLIACRDSGQLAVVDVLASQLDWDAPATLQQLYGLIRSTLINSQAAMDDNHTSTAQQDPQIVPCTVFCDGLSSLAALVDETGGSFEAAAQGHSSSTLGGGFHSPWTAFMHYLVLMGQGSGLGAASAVVVLVHEDVDADQQWQRVLDYGSDTIVAVHALESGHSADVSGEMTVLRRTEPVLAAPQGAVGAGRVRERLSAFYFRTTDNAVTFVRKSLN